MNALISILTACAPILVALVGIIPTVVANRKKTDASIRATNDAVQQQVSKIQDTLNSHIKEDEDEKARNKRYRILRFFDEICEHRRHSESHFEDILDDIDNYEQYCIKHPEFRNSRGQAAMHTIKNVYGKIKAEGGFLTHDSREGE